MSQVTAWSRNYNALGNGHGTLMKGDQVSIQKDGILRAMLHACVISTDHSYRTYPSLRGTLMEWAYT